MNYWFSPKNNAFYPVALKQSYEAAGSLPDDLVEVSDDVFIEYSGNPPEGKVRGVGADLMPCWKEIPATSLSKEEIKAQARRLRDRFIEATDKMMVADYTISDVRLTEDQRDELSTVRATFKSWPESNGWPDIELPEIPRWILIEAVNNGYVVPNWPS